MDSQSENRMKLADLKMKEARGKVVFVYRRPQSEIQINSLSESKGIRTNQRSELNPREKTAWD